MTLPTFLIIGAARAGTTSLHAYLAQHPAVYMSPVKETNYFWYEGQRERRPAVKTRAEYERLFAGVTTEIAVGEASPQYLNSPTAPDRIARELPGVRLIASLRQPVDRAYSGYLGRLRNGRERRPLPEALRPGTEFVEHSLYAPRLRRYLDRFPRERLHILLFDDFAARPAATVQEIYAFVGVEPGFTPDTRVAHNAALVPRSVHANRVLLGALRVLYPVRPWLPAFARGRRTLSRLHRATLVPPPPLPDDLRADLLRLFRDDILRTGDLIGRDLSAWLAPS